MKTTVETWPRRRVLHLVQYSQLLFVIFQLNPRTSTVVFHVQYIPADITILSVLTYVVFNSLLLALTDWLYRKVKVLVDLEVGWPGGSRGGVGHPVPSSHSCKTTLVATRPFPGLKISQKYRCGCMGLRLLALFQTPCVGRAATRKGRLRK